jgi:hypothetical protein
MSRYLVYRPDGRSGRFWRRAVLLYHFPRGEPYLVGKHLLHERM